MQWMDSWAVGKSLKSNNGAALWPSQRKYLLNLGLVGRTSTMNFQKYRSMKQGQIKRLKKTKVELYLRTAGGFIWSQYNSIRSADFRLI